MIKARLNHADNKVKCINQAVGAEKGVITFTSDLDTVNHAVAAGEKSESTITVEVTTLDDSLEGDSPSLIKIDVEGYELPVLEGAHRTLETKRLNAIILELNGSGSRYGYDESNILNLMLEHDFKTYSYDPFKRKLTDLNGKNLISGNTLFIRDKLFVEDRIKTSPKLVIHDQEF